MKGTATTPGSANCWLCVTVAGTHRGRAWTCQPSFLGPRQRVHCSHSGDTSTLSRPRCKVMDLTHASRLLSTLPYAHVRASRVTHPETSSCQLPRGWGLGSAQGRQPLPVLVPPSCAVSVACSSPFPDLASAPSTGLPANLPRGKESAWCFPDVRSPRWCQP